MKKTNIFQTYNFNKGNLGNLARQLEAQSEAENLENILDRQINVLDKHAEIIQCCDPVIIESLQNYRNQINQITVEETEQETDPIPKTDIEQMVEVVSEAIVAEIANYEKMTTGNQLKDVVLFELRKGKRCAEPQKTDFVYHSDKTSGIFLFSS